MTVLVVVWLLVIFPAMVGLILNYAKTRAGFRIGAPLIYRQREASTRPGSDAHDVRPAARGDFYYYSIINYLRVVEVLKDGRIIAISGNNKRLCFWPDDSSLRRARLTERLLHWPQFPRTQRS